MANSLKTRMRSVIRYVVWLLVILGLLSQPVLAVSTEPVRFAFIADIQGRVPLVPPSVLTEHIANINNANVDLVIIGGDLFAGYSGSTKLLRKEWEVFKNQIASRLNAPILPVIGNHDVYNPTALSIWREVFPQHTPYYVHKYQDVYFINLNSEENYERNSISRTQIQWLKSTLELATANQARAIIVSMHKPLWLFMKNWRYEVEPLLVKHKVNYVLAGHHHMYCLESRQGIKYVRAGGGGGLYEYQYNPALGSLYHFLLFDLDADNILRMQVITRDNEKLPETCVTRELQNYLLPLYSSTKVSSQMINRSTYGLTFSVSNPHSNPLTVQISFKQNPLWQLTDTNYEFQVPPRGRNRLTVSIQPRSRLASINNVQYVVKIVENYKGTQYPVFVYPTKSRSNY